MSSREKLLAMSGRRKFETIDVDGNPVRLRSVLASEFARVEAKVSQASSSTGAKRASGLANANALIAQIHIVDDDGNLVFAEDDLPALRELPNDVMQRIVSCSLALSGISGEDIEELAKN